MGKIVIVGYKPKEGKATALKALIQTHLPRLRQEGLITDRKSIIMEPGDGTIVEVFEWLSEEAIQNAHKNPEVLKMWGEYAEVCDYVSIGSLAEAGSLFSSFEAMD